GLSLLPYSVALIPEKTILVADWLPDVHKIIREAIELVASLDKEKDWDSERREWKFPFHKIFP
ncbi:unnamed protein product, partial [Amoebophrya sp. A25]